MPIRYSKSAEEGLANFTAPSVEVFDQFLSLCDAAGPERCALAGGAQTATQRWERLVARTKREPIQAPGGSGTSLSRPKLSYGGLLASQFQPMRAPGTWPNNAANLAAAVRATDRNCRTQLARPPRPTRGAAGSPRRRDPVRRRAGPPGTRGLAEGVQAAEAERVAPGTAALLVGMGPCASWPVRGEDAYRGPWNASTPNPILLINQTHDPTRATPTPSRWRACSATRFCSPTMGYGHVFFQNPSACVDKAMADYLTELIVPPEGSVCQSDQRPFDPDFFVG